MCEKRPQDFWQQRPGQLQTLERLEDPGREAFPTMGVRRKNLKCLLEAEMKTLFLGAISDAARSGRISSQ